MVREFHAVYERSEQQAIDMRTAAYAPALSRIGQAIESQGTSTYFTSNQ